MPLSKRTLEKLREVRERCSSPEYDEERERNLELLPEIPDSGSVAIVIPKRPARRKRRKRDAETDQA
jgi:hypothetical protein